MEMKTQFLDQSCVRMILYNLLKGDNMWVTLLSFTHNGEKKKDGHLRQFENSIIMSTGKFDKLNYNYKL